MKSQNHDATKFTRAFTFASAWKDIFECIEELKELEQDPESKYTKSLELLEKTAEAVHEESIERHQ